MRNILCFLFCIFSSSLISCSQKEYQEITDLERNNMKGDISLVIEIENGGEKRRITKYNRYGNVKYSYYEFLDGNLYQYHINERNIYHNSNKPLVEESNGYSLSFSGYVSSKHTSYKKFYYENDKITIKERYWNDNMIYKNVFIRNALGYKEKEIEYNYKKNSTMPTDSTIIFYKYNKEGKCSLLREVDDRREIIKIYDYDNKGRLIKESKKDTSKNDEDSYNKVSFQYNYDKYDNVIYSCKYDSTFLKRKEIFVEYEYDSMGNWIKRKEFDGFHKVLKIQEREIEYFPKDNSTNKVDYTWENEQSPLDKRFREEWNIKRQKESSYLDLNILLKLFYSNIRSIDGCTFQIIGRPTIQYREGSYCIYDVYFFAYYSDRISTNIEVEVKGEMVIDIENCTSKFTIIESKKFK